MLWTGSFYLLHVVLVHMSGCTAAGWSETILSHGLTAAEAAHTAVVTAVVTAFGYTCSVCDYQRPDYCCPTSSIPKRMAQRCHREILQEPIQVDSPAASLRIIKVIESDAIAT